MRTLRLLGLNYHPKMKYLAGFLVSCALGSYAIAETETQVSQPKEHVSYTNYRGKIFEALEEQEYLKQTRIFSEKLLKSIRREIQKSAYSDKIKAEMLEVLDVLQSEGVYERSGADSANRAVFVGIQGAIESAIGQGLKRHKIAGSVGVVYTPRPPTPLCVKPGKVDTAAANKEVLSDPQRTSTIQSRAQIVRSYLEEGGKLYVVFPEKGAELRTAEQQEVFKTACKRYQGELFVREIDPKNFKKDQVGAAYKISSWDSSPILFSIKSTQALDPRLDADWKLWFGPIVDGSPFAARWAGFAKEAE